MKNNNITNKIVIYLLVQYMYMADTKCYLELNRLLDSLVVECWLRVREVPGSILSQGPRHTKDVINIVPVVPLFSTQH